MINHTNATPPVRAECQTCKGKGQNERYEIWRCYPVCADCAGTGLCPIPISEVISGLRLGDSDDDKRREWDGS